MKIYTKTGDQGQTSLVGGARVAKTHIRLESYGTIDELNSMMGLAIASLESSLSQSSDPAELSVLIENLKTTQHRLFNIGSLLACEDSKISENLPSIEDKDLKKLEIYIDVATAALPPLKEFILPGGSLPAAHLQVARTLARRAERNTVHLSESNAIQPLILPYINRLSDFLFVAARRANQLLGQADVPWKKDL